MSCGGIVIETIIAGDCVWIDTKEKPHYRSSCAIYVENTPAARCVGVGDTVWWQGNRAFWTPKSNGKPIERRDGKINIANVVLKRRGCSGVSRPEPSVCSQFEASDYENTMCARCGFLQSRHK